MNKFHYALIVFTFGFISVAGISNFYAPVVALAIGSQQVITHDDQSSSHQNDTHDSSTQENDSHQGDTHGSSHDGENHDSDSHNSSGDNHDSDDHGSTTGGHDSNGHDSDDHSGDNHGSDDHSNGGHSTDCPAGQHKNGDKCCDDDNHDGDHTPKNASPLANAGVDQAITLPANSVVLNASGSTDSDGTIVSYVWDFVSGPATVDPADTITADASGLTEGTYVFKLTVTDNDGATGTDTVTIVVNPSGSYTGLPACSDLVDDDADNLIDANDPGCHTDGNPTHTDTYNPNDDAETDVPACSNTGDDDADNLIDANDPGCHTDGNASNTASYDPNDNNETNTPVVVVTNPPQCSDGIDNDNDGKIDYPADKGCKNAQDDNEKNSTGSTGGGSVRPIGQVLSAQDTCGIYVDKYLRVGHANNVETVKKVQTFMNDYMNAGLVVDGVYGVKTETAVRNFQVAHADKVLAPWNIDHQSTGIFYLTTETEVNNIMCPTLNLPIPANLINFSQNPNTPAAVQTTAVAPYSFPVGTNI